MQMCTEHHVSKNMSRNSISNAIPLLEALRPLFSRQGDMQCKTLGL